MKKIEIYFGTGETKDGTRISSEAASRALDGIKGHAVSEFGGVTICQTEGSWFSKTLGYVVHEPGAVVVVLVSEQSPDLSSRLSHLVKRIKAELDQESIYVVSSLVQAELL